MMSLTMTEQAHWATQAAMGKLHLQTNRLLELLHDCHHRIQQAQQGVTWGCLTRGKIELFLDEGCGCSGHKGLLCSERFTPNDVLQFRSDCSEMTRTELDLVILGKLSATMSVMGSVGREHKHADRLRVRSRTAYAHQGWPICASMFRFLHTVGKKWLHCTCKN